jgi:hypothetical protein
VTLTRNSFHERGVQIFTPLTSLQNSAFILFKLPTTNKQETQDKELADYEKVLTMPYKRMPIIYNVLDYFKFSVIGNPR